MVVDRSALRRTYVQHLLLAVAAGVGVVAYGITGRASAVMYVIAAAGALLVSASLWALRSIPHLAAWLDGDGLHIVGAWGTRRLAWEDIDAIGWLVLPAVEAYARDTLFLIAQRRDRRIPTVVWATRESIARRAGISQADVNATVEQLCAEHDLPYRPRVPALNPYLYSWIAAATIVGLTILFFEFNLRFH